ncbi:5-(carboxyamino)imidazole ribonucleotide synthase [Acidaminobacter sp. JC074]|uniref:5-(carboxyamino)imidazole ribonucleotide synthase n=1 Tax=Acidaminobacter sp. JC074 TaxID=2530199 RepID=UPI001F115699|nr:5-(carboxyamino)imidazole ribonucleotide synthase [Acidaminobacter sp. JC074]MCH4889943.1 5-(carboxyamino)imidazole ribonucleotide synthase [Acidaminobacter sp. JC074]
MNPLNKKIGIIGGGQLGKMMILDAKRLGFKVVTLDPTEDCPSHSISDTHIVASFHDKEAYKTLAESVDVITYEFEHIDADLLIELEEAGHVVYPTASSLKIIQNKFTQKSLLREKGIEMPDFIKVDSLEDLKAAGMKFGYPYMLKATTGGYDGKGNAVVKNEDDIENQYNVLGGGKVDLMAEKFLNFSKEISVLACRGIDGEITVYPVAENIHKDSILDETIVPAEMTDESQKKAMKMAHDVMEIFEGVGMFCTEMFLDDEGGIYLNEVAPRPHNSGHYTIEATISSQYEQHIRAITGLPLGDVNLISPVVMRNILGSGQAGVSLVTGIEETYKNPRVKVHIYGKASSKPGRKMGHLTVVGNDINQVRKEANEAYHSIKIIGGDK